MDNEPIRTKHVHYRYKYRKRKVSQRKQRIYLYFLLFIIMVLGFLLGRVDTVLYPTVDKMDDRIPIVEAGK